METVEDIDNLLDPGIYPAQKGPPHALFDRWRATSPVHWNPPSPAYHVSLPGSSMTKGFWVLTRYQDVVDVSRDQERFSSYEGGSVIWDLDDEMLARQRASFMNFQPGPHAAIKRVIWPAFAANAIRSLGPDIERLAAELVDEVAARGECEFVFDVASKLPVYTFCTLMGIPEKLRAEVVDLGNAIADVETTASRAADPYIRLFQIAEDLSDAKRRRPDGSLMSLLVHDTTLGLEQIHINLLFQVIAVAGHETTRSTAAHFIQLLQAHPDQYQLLLADVDAHLENAIEEVLRFTSTTTQFRRTATIDTEIGGHPVKAGDKIYLSYAAANRDPAVFPDPHRFDIERANAKRHIAFGSGPHVCIGAQLARLQLKALLQQIVTRIPDIRLTEEPEWLRSIWFNAIVRMPIAFTPTDRKQAA
jgi:cytochrome P450